MTDGPTYGRMNQKQRKRLLTMNGFSEEDAEIISKLSIVAGILRQDEVDRFVKSLGPSGIDKINKATEIYSQMVDFRKNKKNNNLM